nr:MAG TPA: hypothetical protein [Caudoviricetes sp.]
MNLEHFGISVMNEPEVYQHVWMRTRVVVNFL